MMQELLEEIPELQEDERTIVSTRVFKAPREMFERLAKVLSEKGASA